MIKIGVNEPVVFTKGEINDKGTLGVFFKEVDENKKKLSMLDALNESDDTSGQGEAEGSFLLFIPSTEYQNVELAPERKIQNLMKLKNQLQHILQQFTVGKNIKWAVTKGILGITTEEQLLEKVQDPAVYKAIYDNICTQFVEQSKKFTNSTKKLRLFLVRQSAEKSFGRLRDNYLDKRPFLEDFAIPKAQSKMWVKAGTKGATAFFEPDTDGFVPNFDDYEINKGLDNPVRSSTKGDAATNTPEEAAQVEGVFGGGAAAEEAVDFSTGAGFGMPDEATEIPGLTEETDKAE